MNGEIEHGGEEQSLRSWHPAHIPDQHNASGIGTQLSNNSTPDSSPSHESVQSSPPVSQQQFSLLNHSPEVLPDHEPSKNETFNPPETSVHNDTDILESDDRVQGDDLATKEHGHESITQVDKAEEEQRDTGIVNGLSFVDSAISKPFGSDLPQATGAEYARDEDIYSQELGRDSGLHGGGEGFEDSGALNRTNSFPAVPPLHHAHEAKYKAHAQSQIENIMEGDEELGGRAQRSLEFGAPEQTDRVDFDQDNFFGDTQEGRRDDFFAQSTDVESAEYPLFPSDDEARYEEGLPLMQPKQSTKQAGSTPNKLEEPQDSPDIDSVTHDHEFFGEDTELPEQESFFKPKPLDRKTTSQVLDNMSYPPHSTNHDETTQQKSWPSIESVSGGGIAVSSSTVVSQVLAERSQSVKDSPTGDEDLAAMWQAALDDDDLLDDNEESASQSTSSTAAQSAANHQDSLSPVLQPVYSTDGRMRGFEYPKPAQSNSLAALHDRYSPAQTQPSTAPVAYPNPSPLAVQQSRGSSTQYSSNFSSGPSGVSQSTSQQPQQSHAFAPPRPSMPKSAESFVDKLKGGYTSPYDLPMDVTRPKKRTNLQQMQNVANPGAPSQAPPPPRSSSMFARTPPSDVPSPPVPPVPGVGPSVHANRPVSSNIQQKPSIGSFFEELPMTKSRPSSSAGKYAPAAPMQSPSQLPLHPDPPRQIPSTQPPPLSKAPNAASAASSYQLTPPERHSPYANIPHQDNTNDAPPLINSRYSPAPGLQPHVPPPRHRYAASPSTGSRPSPSTHAMSFQPRTSSPLAYSSTASQQQHRHGSLPNDTLVRSSSPQKTVPNPSTAVPQTQSTLPQVDERFEESISHNVQGAFTEASPQDSQLTQDGLHQHLNLSTDPLQNPPSELGTTTFPPDSRLSLGSPDLHVEHQIRPHPQLQRNSDARNIRPPRRSQTQSPTAATSRPEIVDKANDKHQRPTSAGGHASHVRAEPPVLPSYPPTSRNANSSSHDVNYIRPTDGREHDPLERWKGAPILKFGFGGTIVSSFPKHIPRYATGHGFPMIKCNPGEIKLQSSNMGILGDDIARFPGPLKSKGKKKELLEWLQQKIETLEQVQASIVSSSSLPDPIKKHEEKILLWQVVKVYVEYDGTISGNSKAESSVRAILCPDIAQSEHDETFSAANGGFPAGISRPEGTHPVADAARPGALESVRKLLLQGEREKAIWHAVDKRMWAHAMIIASTHDKSTWKQVLHEFTRLEVKTYGDNTHSLAALYEVFAGNWDESIDQLVPPSARAGLQMVSKAASAGPTRNALDGLDKWRETLALILSNRTQDDEAALVALGRLLVGYGRIEAAHLCFLFAKATGLFGSTEESQTSVALLGADHQQQPFDYGRDLDSILLTEVYEFARSVLAPSGTLSTSPHLQSYKLYHAMLLADHGHRTEAQHYCDAIMSTLKSTTKPSPYYHGLLFNALDDLVERLQQGPRDGSSWMSNPMDKVSGSVWKKLNNFIVGDESDTTSVASGKGDPDAGPFARVAAETPSISRSGSSTNLYSTFGSQAVPSLPAATTFGSRYAPSNHYAPSGQLTPRSSLEQQTQPSEESQRNGQPGTSRPSQAQFSNLSNQIRYTTSPAPPYEPSVQQEKSRYQPSPYISPKPETYLPTPPSQPEYMPTAPPDDPSSSLYPQSSYQPDIPSDHQAPQKYDPNDDRRPNSSYEPPASTYEPVTSTYQAPSSYTSYDPDDREDRSPTAQRSPVKKKSFMDDDDDDDFAARAAAILKNDKARKDREADDAFRKAAEADGMASFDPAFSAVDTILTCISSKGPEGSQIQEVLVRRGGWMARRQQEG